MAPPTAACGSGCVAVVAVLPRSCLRTLGPADLIKRPPEDGHDARLFLAGGVDLLEQRGLELLLQLPELHFHLPPFGLRSRMRFGLIPLAFGIFFSEMPLDARHLQPQARQALEDLIDE